MGTRSPGSHAHMRPLQDVYMIFNLPVLIYKVNIPALLCFDVSVCVCLLVFLSVINRDTKPNVMTLLYMV